MTPPLSPAAAAILRALAGEPMPRSAFHPGAVQRLERDRLVEVFFGSGSSVRSGRSIRWLQLTDAGHRRMEEQRYSPFVAAGREVGS